MKIEQAIEMEGITTTLSVEVPYEAVERHLGHAPSLGEVACVTYEVLLEAAPEICAAIIGALTETSGRAHGIVAMKAFQEVYEEVFEDSDKECQKGQPEIQEPACGTTGLKEQQSCTE